MAGELTVGQAREMIPFLRYAYGETPQPPLGWHQFDSELRPETGLRTFALQNDFDPTKIVIVTAGTQFSDPQTIGTDLYVVGNTFPTEYMDQFRVFLDRVSIAVPQDSQITFGGHSLGAFPTQKA